MNTRKPWKSDDGLFAMAQREPFTCVVGDVMDTLELQHQLLAWPHGSLQQIE